MKSLCVFTGANCGKDSIYIEALKLLAQELAKRDIQLIYGGGKLGLMGILANTIIEKGGSTIGIIARSLYEEEAHLGLSKLHITETMQERKYMMTELADGFIVCPGGIGTLEEFFEIWNASKIKLHKKPIGIFNVNNYFDKLIEFLSYSIHEKFLEKEVLELIKISDNPGNLLDMIIT